MPDIVSFRIRPMKINDLDHAISLSRAEGWNQTEKDWRLLLENPMNICLVAEHQNKIAGTATALNHANKVAWIGMVLVDKSLRGQGAGKLLLTNIINRLKEIESIKLDATPAGQPLYQNLGFKEEHIIVRMTNTSLNNFHIEESGFEPEPIEWKNLPEVLKLDKKIFGADRTYLLQALFKNYPGKAFLIKRKHKLDGYIFGRDGIRFNYLGPVFAFSSDSARILISKALESLNNESVALDILEDKADLSKWLESAGFEKQRHFVRMYLKSNSYCGQIKFQYLISGPEFG
jgi:ribosomal protein S18 acetylase RimI-like enzyme